MNVIFNCNKLFYNTLESNAHKAVRLCGRGLLAPKEEIDILSYTRTDHEYKIGKLPAGRKLVDLLNVKLSYAVRIAKEHTILHNVTVKLISDNYNICKQFDITDEVILACPYILGQKDLTEKILLVKSFFADLNSFASLLKLDLHELHGLSKLYCKSLINRISVISYLLKVPKHKICHELMNKPFLLWPSLSEIKTNINLLLRYGFTCDEIFRNLSLLQESVVEAPNQFDFTKHPKHYYKATSNTYVLQEYLVDLLECSYRQADSITKKEPILTTVSMELIGYVIETLYVKGFTRTNIVTTPKILTYFIEKIR